MVKIDGRSYSVQSHTTVAENAALYRNLPAHATWIVVGAKGAVKALELIGEKYSLTSLARNSARVDAVESVEFFGSAN